jgi:hypothetical protein
LLPVVALKEATKQYVPAVAGAALSVAGSVKVAECWDAVVVGDPTVVASFTVVPLVQGVPGVTSLQSFHETLPEGTPPVALPVTVAVSPHLLPALSLCGATIVVANPGVAGVTVKHSSDLAVPVAGTLSDDPL